ncbi:MAG: hypothetical protein IJ087_08035 [Eggerthellaceae bacterium]|nr:hypothetical protein [Eggerthellaceae bacterium]
MKAQEVKQEKGKAINRHRAVRYESSTPAVVKAAGVSAGTATVYAYAQNGVFKKVKDTVSAPKSARKAQSTGKRVFVVV